VWERYESIHGRLAAHDQSDYTGLATLTEELRTLETEVTTLEERWLRLTDTLG